MQEPATPRSLALTPPCWRAQRHAHWLPIRLAEGDALCAAGASTIRSFVIFSRSDKIIRVCLVEFAKHTLLILAVNTFTDLAIVTFQLFTSYTLGQLA